MKHWLFQSLMVHLRWHESSLTELDVSRLISVQLKDLQLDSLSRSNDSTVDSSAKLTTGSAVLQTLSFFIIVKDDWDVSMQKRLRLNMSSDSLI